MLGRFHSRLLRLNNREAVLALFLAGALMSFAFAPYYFWLIIFISLPVFYVLLTASSSYKQAARRGFYFGYGFFMAGTWWIANSLLVDADKFAWLLPFSILGLSAVMGLWFGVLGILVHHLRPLMSPLLFAFVWLMVEMFRSVGMFGFPWNLAGYISLASLELAQTASLVSVYGLSFIVVWLALLPIYWLHEKKRRKAKQVTTTAFGLLIAMAGFGMHQLSQPAQFTNTRIRVLQPNIPQEIKGTAQGQQLAIRVLTELTKLKPNDEAPDITIWPETAYPFTVRVDEYQALPTLQGMLITGAVRAEGVHSNKKIWNSILVINANGKVLDFYDKQQLVPFGEFVPLRHVLPVDKITPGDLDFSRGNGPAIVKISGADPFSPQICYEGIFLRNTTFGGKRPSWLLNVTNDGWFGDSQGPYQHEAMVRMRTIEQGLPLVRAANNGISTIVDGRGRIISMLDIGERAVIENKLPAGVRETMYVRIIQPIVVLLFVLLSLYLFYLLHASRKCK